MALGNYNSIFNGLKSVTTKWAEPMALGAMISSTD